MDTEQRQNLLRFIDALPQAAANQLSEKNLDIIIAVDEIGESYEFVLYEMGGICEGVRQVFAGDDSPSNLVSFIQKDEHIEEDNRSKIPALAYDIQTKVFDVALPIMKQAGFPIKEGKVPQPPPPPPPPPAPVPSPYAPVASPLGEMRQMPTAPMGTTVSPLLGGVLPTSTVGGTAQKPPLEEKNMRALMRIASGTNYTEGELRDAFEALPLGLRQSLSSVDTANAIQDIAKKYMLHVDQMAALASETGLVLLGLTHPAEFIKNLATRLRMPDERARDIARDISAQILVKVRDVLRGLHEDVKPQPTSGVISPNKGSTPHFFGKVEGRGVTPSGLAASATSLVREDEAPRLPKSTTPYSAGAKWNTGENVLSKQAEPGPLSRAEVLRGIENPTTAFKPPAPVPPQARSAGSPSLSTGRAPIGPTGWKPSAPDGGKFQVSSLKFQGSPTSSPLKSSPVIPQPPTPPRPPMPPIASSTEKNRPQSEVAFPPPAPKTTAQAPQDFLDQKLSTPMSIPRDEKRYTTDPYREPLQ